MRKVHIVGEQLVNCTKNCNDVEIDRNSGIIPRCLALEIKNRKLDDIGCIIIGLNPGKAKLKEKLHYNEHGVTYGSFFKWWEQCLDDEFTGYYGRMRRFINGLEIKGPILWTELAKCQCDQEHSSLSFQTYRTCSQLYLQREMEIFPSNWPIFAVGKVTYNALTFLYPLHTVIGVAHPTGSRGQAFLGMFDHQKNLQESIKNQYPKQGETIWFSSKSVVESEVN